MRRDPALLERRMQFGPRAESRPRQKIIVAVIFAMFAALLIVPGMDHRFGWSQVPAAIVVLANLLIIADLRSLPRGVARKYVRSLNDHRRGGTACNLHRAIRARAPSDVRGRRPAHFRNDCRAEFVLWDAARGARNPGFDSAHPRRRAHALGQAARLRRLLPHRPLSIDSTRVVTPPRMGGQRTISGIRGLPQAAHRKSPRSCESRGWNVVALRLKAKKAAPEPMLGRSLIRRKKFGQECSRPPSAPERRQSLPCVCHCAA